MTQDDQADSRHTLGNLETLEKHEIFDILYESFHSPVLVFNVRFESFKQLLAICDDDVMFYEIAR